MPWLVFGGLILAATWLLTLPGRAVARFWRIEREHRNRERALDRHEMLDRLLMNEEMCWRATCDYYRGDPPEYLKLQRAARRDRLERMVSDSLAKDWK